MSADNTFPAATLFPSMGYRLEKAFENKEQAMKQRNPVTLVSRLSARIVRLVAIIGLITGSVSAVAQQLGGTLEYGPASNGGGGPGAVTPASIPTLGGTGLVLLSALLLFIFWRLHRRGSIQGARFLTVALISAALASGLGGIKLVSDVVAQTSGTVRPMTEAAGGSLEFNQELGLIGCVHNATQVELQVLAMSDFLYGATVNTEPQCELVSGSEIYDHPGCTVGMVLQPEEYCGASVGANASDARLKEDIVPVGVHESGLALYEFRYVGGTARYRGVMAQEVLNHTPEAVMVMPNGYFAVNYGMLGLEMTEVH